MLKARGQNGVASKRLKARPVVFYGSSSFALSRRHTFCNASLSCTGSAPFEVVAYIDDFRGDQGVSLDEAPVITLETWRKQFPNVPCAIAIGDPKVRRSLASKVKAAGGTFCSLYEISGWISPDVAVGEGTMIALTPTYVGPRVKIGDHVIIMPFAMVGHDCVIGNYVTVCPSVTISGHVIVEDDVFIGVGSSIVNGSEGKPLRIGRGAMVCAGAVVVGSVAPGAKVKGNPAKDVSSRLADGFARGDTRTTWFRTSSQNVRRLGRNFVRLFLSSQPYSIGDSVDVAKD